MPDSPVNPTGDIPASPAMAAPARLDPAQGARLRRDPAQEASRDTLRAVMAAIRQRWRILLGTMLGVPGAAWLVLLQITPTYTATGALMYQASAYQPPELQSMVRQEPTTEGTMSTQAEMLQSLHIAELVATRANLFNHPDFNTDLRPPGLPRRALSWLQALAGMETDAQRQDATAFGPRVDATRNRTLTNVRAVLHAAPVRFSHVIEVTFSASDPSTAAAAVNTAMDAYIKDLFRQRHIKIDQGNANLDSQAAELRVRVQAYEEKIARYRADHALAQGIHAGIDTEQATRLIDELATARAALATADGKLDAARGRKGAAAQAAVTPSVVQIRVQQEHLAAVMQAQEFRLGSAHPEAQGMRRQYAEGQRALAAESDRAVAAIEAERQQAADRVANLEADLRAAETAAGHAEREEIPLKDMARDLDAARGQLQAVLDLMQKTVHQTTLETPEAHEISQALPPDNPSSPRVVASMAAAAAAGVFLGLLLVYVLHLSDTTIQAGEDIRAATGLSCFTLIQETGRRALGHLRIDEYATRRPLTSFAEQIRAARACLQMDAVHPRVVAIAAASSGEGKTVFTLSLGRSAQGSGKRVLVVECDTRQPSFHRRIGCGSGPGLLNILRGEVDWRDTVRDDKLTGMAVITAGKPGGDVPAMFLSHDMTRFLKEIRDAYDLILFDTPPLEAVTEARIAASLADATILCVRWQHTSRGTMMHAVDLLCEAHAKIIGTVLTRVDPRAHLRAGHAEAGVYGRRYRAYYRE